VARATKFFEESGNASGISGTLESEQYVSHVGGISAGGSTPCEDISQSTARAMLGISGSRTLSSRRRDPLLEFEHGLHSETLSHENRNRCLLDRSTLSRLGHRSQSSPHCVIVGFQTISSYRTSPDYRYVCTDIINCRIYNTHLREFHWSGNLQSVKMSYSWKPWDASDRYTSSEGGKDGGTYLNGCPSHIWQSTTANRKASRLSYRGENILWRRWVRLRNHRAACIKAMSALLDGLENFDKPFRAGDGYGSR
jgi:hypothetical protein